MAAGPRAAAAAAALLAASGVSGRGLAAEPPTAPSASPWTTARPAAAAPACPRGTEPRGGVPFEQYEAYCVARDDAGQPVREGPSRSWYDTGALRTDERWRAGRREGRFVEYHRNGRVAREGSYRADVRVGTWTIWFESGHAEEVATYSAGERDGPFTTYWPSGRKRAEGRHCGGAQCGTWVTWDESGREIGRVDYAEQSKAP